eukprot:scaffold124162_cov57-Phaeocystis_antarctica.AAC.1
MSKLTKRTRAMSKRGRELTRLEEAQQTPRGHPEGARGGDVQVEVEPAEERPPRAGAAIQTILGREQVHHKTEAAGDERHQSGPVPEVEDHVRNADEQHTRILVEDEPRGEGTDQLHLPRPLAHALEVQRGDPRVIEQHPAALVRRTARLLAPPLDSVQRAAASFRAEGQPVAHYDDKEAEHSADDIDNVPPVLLIEVRVGDHLLQLLEDDGDGPASENVVHHRRGQAEWPEEDGDLKDEEEEAGEHRVGALDEGNLVEVQHRAPEGNLPCRGGGNLGG